MSFVSNLFKGFIRSAVNQVGRDGGKVISNKIYGGAHSSPIHSPEYYRSTYIDSSPIPKAPNVLWNVIMFAFWVLFIPVTLFPYSYVISLFFPLLFIGRLYRPLFNKYVHPRVSKFIYKSDRRFTTGRKAIGSYKAVDKGIRVPLYVTEIKTYRTEGIIKGLIFLISYSLMIANTQSKEFKLKEMQSEEKIKLITKGDTLFKNEKFIYYYGKIENAGVTSFKTIAYDTLSKCLLFVEVDSLQLNEDTRTEMEKVSGSPEFKNFHPAYKIMFKIKPIVNPILNSNEGMYRDRRIDKDFYINPSDVNVGEKKLQLIF